MSDLLDYANQLYALADGHVAAAKALDPSAPDTGAWVAQHLVRAMELKRKANLAVWHDLLARGKDRAIDLELAEMLGEGT